jgi:RHS repeat-associated protein
LCFCICTIYTYLGNRLDKVVDATNSPQGFNDLTATTVNDFSYDTFGNLTSDLNKGIATNGIVYNHLNQPIKITMNSVAGTGTISYIYNATGAKLRKIVLNSGVSPNITTTVDYLGLFQYLNTVLDFITTSQGYVKNTVVNSANTYNYVYNYTDHLGNVRVSYTVDPVDGVLKIMEENHYYPFGLKHTGYNSTQNIIVVRQSPTVRLTPVNSPDEVTYNYKYNSKELQVDLGINMYDYGARNYDPGLGRWMNIDPLAEKSRKFSPYSYALNNPVFFIDPDGMQVDPGSQKEWDRQKRNVMSKREQLNKKIDRVFKKAFEKGWSDAKISKKLGDLQDRSASLSGTLVNLANLESSTQVYSLNQTSSEIGGTSYDPTTGNVVFKYKNTANFVHETTHGGQFENGEIGFDKVQGTGVADDLVDETSAYKAQFAYDPSSVSGLSSSSVANSFAKITPGWVQQLKTTEGSFLYTPTMGIGQSPVNMNTPKAGIIAAYPNFAQALATEPADTTFKDDINIYYKKP